MQWALQTPRDHGGNLDQAVARFGGARADWMDLSTGINPRPYPVGTISSDAFAALPRRADMARLCAQARETYQSSAPVAAFAGAQGAIQALPYVLQGDRAAVVAPTYNEHAAAFRAAGWQVAEVAQTDALAGADVAVVVNPNNPDGRFWERSELIGLSRQVGWLVIDESFADMTPELSLASRLSELENVVVLRSFGKFFGLAGLRLGFALAAEPVLARLRDHAGPWPVAGPALEIATRALADMSWQAATCDRLAAEVPRMDALAAKAGWQLVGGTSLFRSYATPDAVAAQERLANVWIWSRIFPYDRHWIRLGLPADETAWARLTSALEG